MNSCSSTWMSLRTERACPLRQAQCNAWADSGFRQACPWGGSLNGWETDERMDGAQMEVASDWVRLSLRGFWVSVGVSVGASGRSQRVRTLREGYRVSPRGVGGRRLAMGFVSLSQMRRILSPLWTRALLYNYQHDNTKFFPRESQNSKKGVG